MKVRALVRLNVQGRWVEAGEVFDLPSSLQRYVEYGWVQAIDAGASARRVAEAPQTRVEPQPETRKRTKKRKK